MIKSLLMTALLLLSTNVAAADNLAARLSHDSVVQSFELHGVAAEISAKAAVVATTISTKAAVMYVAEGTFYLTSTTCGGAKNSFFTRLLVTQNGRNFTVKDPVGEKLKGKGTRGGFRVTSSKTNGATGITTFLELTAGPISRNRTANFRFSGSLHRKSDGASCQSVFDGTLRLAAR